MFRIIWMARSWAPHCSESQLYFRWPWTCASKNYFLILIFQCIDAVHLIAGKYLLQCVLSHRLLGNLCSGAPLPLPSSLIWGLARLFLAFVFLMSHSFLPSLVSIFPEVPPFWLLGPSVPCGGAAGASWSCLCPARGRPGLCSQKSPACFPSCHSLAT